MEKDGNVGGGKMVSKEGKDSYGDSSDTFTISSKEEQLEIVQFLVKTCPTVDLIGQTDSMVGVVYIMLHCIQRRMFKHSNSSLTITMEKTSKTSSIRRMNDGYTPLDYAYIQSFPYQKGHCRTAPSIRWKSQFILIKMEICRKMAKET